MAYTPILNNPIEWNEQEPQRCKRCDTDILTPEEVEEKMCFECMEEMELQDENTNFKNL
tara:strand:+ start:136 stop:312 length:177 start_codon:yes stop_codon:yes gene_type:complete